MQVLPLSLVISRTTFSLLGCRHFDTSRTLTTSGVDGVHQVPDTMRRLYHNFVSFSNPDRRLVQPEVSCWSSVHGQSSPFYDVVLSTYLHRTEKTSAGKTMNLAKVAELTFERLSMTLLALGHLSLLHCV